MTIEELKKFRDQLQKHIDDNSVIDDRKLTQLAQVQALIAENERKLKK